MVNTNELAAARKRVGFSQEETARQLGISTTSYGSKENGRIDFKLAEVLKLCDILHISESDRPKIFLL